MVAKKGSREHPHRGEHGRFITDTEHMLGKLREAAGLIQGQRTVLDTELRTVTTNYAAKMASLVNQTLLPDLEPRTVARLKRDCPGFVTAAVQQSITSLSSIEVPLWDWAGLFFTHGFGASAAYRKEKAGAKLSLLRVQLKQWLESTDPAPACMNAIRQISAGYQEKDARRSALAAQESALARQIRDLEQVRTTYSRVGAPAPSSDLSNAVRRGSTRMRDDSWRSSDDFDVIRDVVVPQIIIDNALRDHEERVRAPRDDYRRRDEYSPPGDLSRDAGIDDIAPSSRRRRDPDADTPREERGGGLEVNTESRSGREDRGGGFEVSMARDESPQDRGGGFEVNMSGSSSRGDLS